MFNSARKPRQPNAVDFSSGFSNALRIVLFTAALSAGVAHADDYADVNRLVRAGQLISTWRASHATRKCGLSRV